MAEVIDNKQLRGWVREARLASAEWRADSWRDCEMYDGHQWTQDDWQRAVESGITPLTINRIFPTINLVLGTQVINKLNVVAKARTVKDSEVSQVMTEGIQFVMDQYDGEFKVSQAFRDAIISGFGCLAITLNSDPRYERIKLAYRDWKEIFYDPFSSPWVDSSNCRYVFHQRWMDLAELMSLFPEHKKELEEYYRELSSNSHKEGWEGLNDEADFVEEYISGLTGGHWADKERKRVRPVEMWYTVYEKAVFAVFGDGRVFEINEDMSTNDQYELVRRAQEVIPAVVRKMKVATFLGELEFYNMESPFGHDLFPFVPFVAYCDRFKFPFGVPRQVRGQNEEVNKRRSMALALINSRRVITEADVVDSQESLQALYEEANKLDGFMIVNKGKLDKFKIIEQGSLAAPQISLMQQNESEIQQISGENDERMGYRSNVTSGVALEKRMQQGATITAPLFDNLRRSLKIMGTHIVSCIQNNWTKEKVLRVTDRLTGAEKFVAINQQLREGSGEIVIKNNVTQGKYDVIISDAPLTDTVREQNLNLIIEWVKKSPPEAIPHLMALAFEMSNIPNKDQLMLKIKPLLGLDPTEEDMSQEELKQRVVQELQAQAQQQQAMAQQQQQVAQVQLETMMLENEKLKAEIAEIQGRVMDKPIKAEMETKKLAVDIAAQAANADVNKKRAELEGVRAQIEKGRHELESLKTGFDMQMEALKNARPSPMPDKQGEYESERI